METASTQKIIEIPRYEIVLEDTQPIKSPEELLISQWKSRKVASITIPEFNTAKDLLRVKEALEKHSLR